MKDYFYPIEFDKDFLFNFLRVDKIIFEFLAGKITNGPKSIEFSAVKKIENVRLRHFCCKCDLVAVSEISFFNGL